MRTASPQLLDCLLSQADCPSGLRVARIFAALLAESTQRIYRVAAGQLARLGESLVRRAIGVEDHLNNRFRLLDNGGARQNAHSADESIDADKQENLRVVAHEGVRVDVRRLVDELLV